MKALCFICEDRFESVTFSLYVNGFAFSTLDGREATSNKAPVWSVTLKGRMTTL